MKYFLFLITYAACADPVYDMLQGPFNFEEDCQTQIELLIAVKGPPEPGSIYRCEQRKHRAIK